MLRMICVDETLLNGPGYLVAGTHYRVGRSSTCAFVIGDRSVSRFHAEMTVTESSVLLKDMGSRNGTFVDGVRLQEADVRPGQAVRFGNSNFQLVNYDEDDDDPRGSEMSTFILKAPPEHQALVAQLSDAQQRVLDLLLDGKSEKEVAYRLDISQHTVHNHVKEIYKRMHVNSRGELLAIFVAESKKLAAKGK